MDRTTIVPRSFHKWLYNTAKKEGIPVQYKQAAAGGNDAGAIHLAAGGVKTASVSVPCRYLHSPVCVVDKGDVEAVKKLTEIFLERIDEVI